MNRVISDVFPTDCSPRNTSLNLRIALPYSPPGPVALVAMVARSRETMYGRRRTYPARPGRARRRVPERRVAAGARAGALVDAAWRACVVRPAARAAHVAYAVVGSPTSHRVVLRLAMLSALHVACVAMAVLAYIGFYHAWVPDAAVHKDVHLQFAHGGAPPAAHVLLDGGDADVPVWQTEPSVPLFREGVAYDVALEMRVLMPRGVQDSTLVR